jgi:hypothetical protein
VRILRQQLHERHLYHKYLSVELVEDKPATRVCLSLQVFIIEENCPFDVSHQLKAFLTLAHVFFIKYLLSWRIKQILLDSFFALEKQLIERIFNY